MQRPDVSVVTGLVIGTEARRAAALRIGAAVFAMGGTRDRSRRRPWRRVTCPGRQLKPMSICDVGMMSAALRLVDRRREIVGLGWPALETTRLGQKIPSYFEVYFVWILALVS